MVGPETGDEFVDPIGATASTDRARSKLEARELELEDRHLARQHHGRQPRRTGLSERRGDGFQLRRYPHRNQLLGRESTADELAFLRESDFLNRV